MRGRGRRNGGTTETASRQWVMCDCPGRERLDYVRLSVFAQSGSELLSVSGSERVTGTKDMGEGG